MRRTSMVIALAAAMTARSARPAVGDPLASLCPQTNPGLVGVATALAQGRIAGADVESLTFALRAAGEPHVWPRAMTLEAPRLETDVARARILRWLAELPHRGHVRCAIARATVEGKTIIASVAVDAQADLAPLPLSARPGSWLDVDARTLVSASAAKIVVLGPSGPPHAIPTSFGDGRVRGRFHADRAGEWMVQVVIDGDGGPRPVLEGVVFVGIEAPTTASPLRAIGEDAAPGGDDEATLANMVSVARESEGVPPLERSGGLDRVAREHAQRMMRAGELAHDAGDGDLRERLAARSVDAREVGENVAHGATIALAHRALWASPSHRANLLLDRFARVGIGVARDRDRSVWVTEVFASDR